MILKNDEDEVDVNSVKVISPQFRKGQWDYHWNNQSKELIEEYI